MSIYISLYTSFNNKRSPLTQSQGCHAGSILQRLSVLQAAATSWPTLLSVPSKELRLVSLPVMAVTAFPTRLMITSPSFCSVCKK